MIQHALFASNAFIAILRRDLSQLLWAAARWGYQPSAAWMYRFLDTSYCQLRVTDSQSLSVTLWALATLGLDCRPPQSWLEAFCESFGQRMQYSSTQSLSNVVWALATMDYYPGQEFLDR